MVGYYCRGAEFSMVSYAINKTTKVYRVSQTFTRPKYVDMPLSQLPCINQCIFHIVHDKKLTILHNITLYVLSYFDLVKSSEKKTTVNECCLKRI